MLVSGTLIGSVQTYCKSSNNFLFWKHYIGNHLFCNCFKREWYENEFQKVDSPLLELGPIKYQTLTNIRVGTNFNTIVELIVMNHVKGTLIPTGGGYTYHALRLRRVLGPISPIFCNLSWANTHRHATNSLSRYWYSNWEILMYRLKVQWLDKVRESSS